MSDKKNGFQYDNYTNEASQEQMILPPGTQNNLNTFGVMKLEFGNILYLDTTFPFANTKLKVKFWGQQKPLTYVAQNCSEDLQAFPKSGIYEIRTPVVLFSKYLEDMVRIKIDVLDKRNDKIVGNIIVNTLLFLKKNVKNQDTQAFEDMHGIFPILKPQQTCQKPDFNTKIGEIEVSLTNQFAQQSTKEYGVYQNIKEFLEHNQEKQTLNTEGNYFEQQQQQQQLQQQQQQQFQQEYDIQNQENIENNNIQQKRESLKVPVINKLNSQNKIQQENQNQNLYIQEYEQEANDTMSQRSFQTQQNSQMQLQQQNQYQQQQSRQSTPSVQQFSQQGSQNKFKQYDSQQLSKKSIQQQQDNPQYFSKPPKQNQQNQFQQQQQQNQEDNLTDRSSYTQKMKDLENQQKKEFYNKLQQQLNLNEQEDLLLAERTRQIIQDNRQSEMEILQLKMDQTELFAKGGEAEGFSDDDEIPDSLPDKIQQKVFKIKEIEKMRFKVQTFKVTNPVYKLRFHGKRVFIECDIPGLQSNETNIVYSRITLGQKSEKNLEYFYNQEYPQKIKFNEQNMSKLLTSPINLKIMIENNQQERVYFGTGTFKLEKLILNDTYSGTFQVTIENKEMQGKLRQNDTEIGQIQIEIQLEKNKKKQEQDLQFNNTQNTLQFTQQQQQKVENLGGQIYLQVHHLQQFSENYDKILFKYRTFQQNQGQSQIIQSEQMQNYALRQIPTNNHQITFPVYTQNVLKMQKMPFLIEVWGIETEEYQKQVYQQKLKDNQLKQRKKMTEMKNEKPFEEFQVNLNPKIIGIAKISLENIFHSIAIVNPGNQKPIIQIQHIKHNLYPIIVAQNQDIQVKNIKTQQQEGQINLTLAFGTVSQIKTFSNQYLQQQQNKNNLHYSRTDDFNQRDNNLLTPYNKGGHSQYQQDGITDKVHDIILHNKDGLEYTNFKKTLQNVDNSQIFGGEKYNLLDYKSLKCFITILENIRKHKRKASVQLREFIIKAQKYNNHVTLKEFYDFVISLPYQDPLKNQITQKLILTLDYKNTGEIFISDFSKSYSSYVYFEEIVRQNHCDVLQDFRVILKRSKFTTNDLDRHLLRYTEFGFIQKHKFREILLSFTKNENEEYIVDNIIRLLDPGDEGMILSTQLSDYLKNQDLYEGMSHIIPHEKHFLQILEKSLAENIYENQDLVLQFTQNPIEEFLKEEKIFYIHDIIEVFETFEIEITFWESLCIIENIQKLLQTKDNTAQLVELGVYYNNLLDYLEYLIKFHKSNLKNESKQNFQQLQLNDSNLNQISQNQQLKNDEDELNLQEIADIVGWDQKNTEIICQKNHQMQHMNQQQMDDYNVDGLAIQCDACQLMIAESYICYTCNQIKCIKCSELKLEKKDYCQECADNNHNNPIQKLTYYDKQQIINGKLDIKPCSVCESTTFPLEYGTYLCSACDFSRCNECYQMSKIY